MGPRTGWNSPGSVTSSRLTRLGTSPDCWQSHLQKLLGKTRWLGTYRATTTERLQPIAANRGVHHVDNALSGLATG